MTDDSVNDRRIMRYLGRWKRVDVRTASIEVLTQRPMASFDAAHVRYAR